MGSDRDKKPQKGARKTPKPYQRPRGGGAKAIGDLMPEIGRTAFRRFGFVQSSVVTRWPEIVGPHHARDALITHARREPCAGQVPQLIVGQPLGGPQHRSVGDQVGGAVREVHGHDEGPLLGACERAEAFLATWQDELPFGRPLA